MKLVNLARTQEELKKETKIPYEEPTYSWGLELRLEDPELEKLGITSLPPVGRTVTLSARAKVMKVREEERNGKADRALTLKVHELGLAPETEGDLASKLYAEGGGKDE